MPRIDPLQLLNCLKVLLTKDGGVLSNEEVQRLASLMTKFSKKLVSKCVYVLILKNTESSLLSAFMSAGGWQLIFVWLQDGTYAKNWPLVQELLELLLLCPVDVERLKSNNIPKLVKSISKREDLAGLYDLANQLVERWLKIVKSETVAQQQQKEVVLTTTTTTTTVVPKVELQLPKIETKQEVKEEDIKNEPEECNAIAPTVFYKISSIKDGKIIAKISSQIENVKVETSDETVDSSNVETVDAVIKDKKEDDKKNKEKSNHDRSKHKSSSSSRSSSTSSKDRSGRDKSSRDKDRSSSSSSKDKSRDKERSKDRDRDKSRSNGSHKSSSSSSSSSKTGSSSSSSSSGKDKEKQAEKDKATLLKVQPPSLNKLGRIPKKPSSDDKKRDDKKGSESSTSTTNHKKSSISIEVRNKEDGRPKTVKVYNAKMRSTGLEETAKPPPPRTVAKKPLAGGGGLPSLPAKRPSPPREPLPPPEKRTKLAADMEDKPGAIKLIAAKPKPSVLQESDLFMDMLTASATSKKEPRKRKRRLSSSKDNEKPSSPPSSPTLNNSGGGGSPLALKNMSAPKFYQDTLETESPTGDEQARKNEDSSEMESERATTPTDADNEIGPEAPDENVVKETDGLKGVLVYLKKKGPKKNLKWKTDADLVEVKYFELDETERVNVTKTFTDMKQFDISEERQALMHRKLNADDVMDEKTMWRYPVLVECIPFPAEPGSKSLEKDIQFAREKTVLQALCFNRSMLPDSPAEPDPEVHPMTDPVLIPLDDDNKDLVTDHTGVPWPEPKGSPPQQALPTMPAGIVPPFVSPALGPGGGFPPGIPPFGPPGGAFNMMNMPMPPNMMPPGPGGGGVEWSNMNGQMPMNMPPDMLNQGPPPSIFGAPPDAFNSMQMNDGGGGFGPPPPQGFQPPPGMFHGNFGPNRGGAGGGNNRGNFRGRGGGGANGPWFRMNGPPQGAWGGPPRGGGGGGAAGAGNNWMGRGVCKNVRNHGFCRQRDTCPFMHPNNLGRNN